MKRVLAVIGIIILAGLYISTLLFAIFDNPDTYIMFRASVAATIAVPVLLYAYIIIYRLLSNKTKDDPEK